MKVFFELKSYHKKPTVITIGSFDGVHMGHKKIIERLSLISKENNLESAILSFSPHPREVLNPNSKLEYLTTVKEKCEILDKTKLQNLILIPFTKEFGNIEAENYVKTILVDALNAKYIIIGYDHKFGKNGTADINDLRKYGKKYGFEVEEINALELEGNAVSSSKIREAIKKGDIVKANNYLGHHFTIEGEIYKGKGNGRKIEYPTANIKIEESKKLIPKIGSYIVKSNINNQVVYGMMNIGNNPTFNASQTTVEVHFFDFEEDLYGKHISVELLKRLRDETKFSSIKQLKEQLRKDEVNSRKFIESTLMK